MNGNFSFLIGLNIDLLQKKTHCCKVNHATDIILLDIRNYFFDSTKYSSYNCSEKVAGLTVIYSSALLMFFPGHISISHNFHLSKAGSFLH